MRPYRPSAADREQELAAHTRWADIREVEHLVRRNEPAAIDRAIAFLAEDPRYFGSGYQKEALWRRLARADLSRKQKARLEAAAVDHLHRRITREFTAMARAMTSMGSAAFWDDVRDRLGHEERVVRKRATVLAAYQAGVRAGEAARRQLRYPS